MKKIFNKKNLFTLLAVVLGYLLIFFLVEQNILSRQYRSLLVPIGVNVILAVSLNLTTGFLGELTLGHAGFMAVGAYAGCLVSISMPGLPPLLNLFIALIVGGLVAAVFGVIIGVPVLRLKGDYLAIVTLAFGEIIRSVIVNLGFTGGAAGLKNIPKNSNYTVVYVVIVITILVIVNLVKSRHGRAICSIRENRIAAESIGINVTYYKILVFVLAAFFAGVAGVLYGQNLGYLQPATFDYNKSIEILVIVVLGGMGSIKGSVISAIIVTLLPEVLRGADDYRMLIYAIVLIAMMLLNGSPKVAEWKEKLFSKLRFSKKRPLAQKGE
ncbi:branched-chain amino acid ABC transporter permease [Fumia xinanensis]|uniref:Branched-chain amino acid ABC transporter permease n=1 Tax=Fumia xinanensis TaxID=2763659 RepID=A0A926I2X5_9FIRM|nr:branched-chain amino acid ABC transporter permease [Fumia xinanensis]MBC8560008.1 branched-chain amino acid ABC transporter permease [Fumia xinanensis]PWL41959.1 MAG: branched-chain amino acid ABC transporter permease [Clostridiales bacterium]